MTSGSIVAITIAGMAFVPTVVFLAIWGTRRERDRRRRHELMELALRQQQLSPETQRELVQALRRPASRGPFVLGWFGAFLGIAWLCLEPRGEQFVAAVMVTVASFALLTLPFALRELDARRA